jgi:hypothetical protein
LECSSAKGENTPSHPHTRTPTHTPQTHHTPLTHTPTPNPPHAHHPPTYPTPTHLPHTRPTPKKRNHTTTRPTSPHPPHPTHPHTLPQTTPPHGSLARPKRCFFDPFKASNRDTLSIVFPKYDFKMRHGWLYAETRNTRPPVSLLLCDNLKIRMFFQNFFSFHYFGNFLTADIIPLIYSQTKPFRPQK